jgi:hypothetical protein
MSGDCSGHWRREQGGEEDLGPARFHRHFLFRHSHGGTRVGRLLARYRITSQGWRNILSATSRPLLSVTSVAFNCFTAVTSVAI